MFPLYDCKVRVGGQLFNEVPKRITAPEAIVLRTVHGSGPDDMDIVVEARPAKDIVKDVAVLTPPLNRDDNTERARLNETYGRGLLNRGDADPYRMLNGIFGVGAELPKEIPGVETAVPVAKKTRGRKSKVTAAAEKAAVPAHTVPFEEPQLELAGLE